MPSSASRGIFLSYRRADSTPHAVMLRSRLRERIPNARVFMDLDSIEPGLEFAEVIREAIDSCAVLTALIGLKWATLADETGHRRLDNPDDYVRFEIQAALERGVRVIPVLVDGARPLQQRQLPAELQKLAQLEALELSYRRYDDDADQLLKLIQRVLVASPPPVVKLARGDLRMEAQKDPELARKHRVRAVRLVAAAEGIADSITDERAKAEALSDIAGVLAATDPDRAERITVSITDKNMKAKALASLAGKLTAIDPNRAERIAQSITNKSMRAGALSDIAGVLAPTDPDRAERITQSITNEYTKAKALADIAWVLEGASGRDSNAVPSFTYKSLKAGALADIVRALAATDPDRAESIALSITDKNTKAGAFADIAGVLAATDPDRAARLSADAERIAQSIINGYTKAGALADLAGKLAATDPDRAAQLSADAERIARSVTDKKRIALLLMPGTSVSLKAAVAWGDIKPLKAGALASLAGKLAATDPDRAERIALSITDKNRKAKALADIAGVLAPTDPDRADHIIQLITNECTKAEALASLAGKLTATDPDRAKCIADSITDKSTKAEALSDIAGKLAATDPDRAESIADSITDKSWKARALVRIAEP